MTEILLPEKLGFLFAPKRIKIAFGGRGGGKTIGFARALLILAAQKPLRILCCREYMRSIDDSVHSALAGEIVKMGLGHLFEVQRNRIIGVNGSLITYAGLARNIESVKSKHDFDICWVEEAETVTERSLDVLEPTIRKPGSEIWYSFNPANEFSAVWVRYVKPVLGAIRVAGQWADKNAHICKINLTDNPFAPQELLDQSEAQRNADLKKWLHIWGGEPDCDYEGSIIQPEWIEAALGAHTAMGWTPRGARVLGFDPADNPTDQGGDEKAVVQRWGSLVEHAQHWGDGELPEAIDRAFSLAADWRADIFVFDATGIGRSVKVGLEKRLEGWKLEVQPFEGGGGVANPTALYASHKPNAETFRNRRAQAYWTLADRFEATYNARKKGIYTDPDQLISIAPDLPGLDVLRAEVTKIKRLRTDNTLIQLEPKSKMTKSPNLADALMMCFANQVQRSTTQHKPLVFTSEF